MTSDSLGIIQLVELENLTRSRRIPQKILQISLRKDIQKFRQILTNECYSHGGNQKQPLDEQPFIKLATRQLFCT